MNTTDRPRFIDTATVLLVLGTTLPGLLQISVSTTRATLAVTYAAVIAAACVGTAGLRWAELRPGLRALSSVTAIYGALVTVALWLSGGTAFLVSMPFVSLMVLYFPLRLALMVAALTVAIQTISVAQFTPDPKALFASSMSFLSAVAFVVVFSFIARRERYARREVERLNREVEELATTRERNRIAREIHDSLGHFLTIATVQLEAARADLSGRDERIARVQQLLRDGLTELRSSVSLLREGAAMPRPFQEAIEGLVDESNAAGLPTQLTTLGASRPLPATVGFTLYRIAQEGLTNVRRHARATRVSVSLDYTNNRVKLGVVDDGIGVHDHPGSGNGLNGLRERVRQTGGTLTIVTSPGHGFQLSVEVPA